MRPARGKVVTLLYVPFLGGSKPIFLFSLLRLVHLPLLYKHIHKKHHEWTAPIGVVSIYAHPLEHIVSDLLMVTFHFLRGVRVPWEEEEW